MIMTCNCKHPFQDRRYGTNKRVFNHTTKGGGNSNAYRCTVCLREKNSEAQRRYN